MDELITTINKLQNYNNKFNLTHIDLPEIIVVGSQSSGKSSVLERIISYDILPKGSQVATRCPINLQLIHNDEAEDITGNFQNNFNSNIVGVENIRMQLQEMTNEISKDAQGVCDTPITVQLIAKSFPTLTLIDLPGIIKNDGELPRGSVERIQQIARKFVASPCAIILAISAANVDLANSDSIQMAREFDPTGQRTLHVITKIDLMDPGTNAMKILESPFVQDSMGTVLLMNRSEKSNKDGLSIQTTNENEKMYLNTYYRHITKNHGIGSLINKLAQKLNEEISHNLPNIQSGVKERIAYLHEEFGSIDIMQEDNMLSKTLITFVDTYKHFVHGDRNIIYTEIQGGAKISQILYNKFVEDIQRCQISDLTKEKISLTMINTAGNKKLSYSIEKSFVIITQNEIEQFILPSMEALKQVCNLLKEFVHEIVAEMNIKNYSNLVDNLEREMEKFIEIKYKYTRNIIDNLIRCEQNDVFCAHPNSQFYESLKTCIKEKTKVEDANAKEASNEKTIEEMVVGYFDMVRQNVIYNLPKWVQKFMIEDLLNEMMDQLHCINDSITDVLKLDSRRENEISEMREELKELEQIQRDLRSFRK